MRRVTWHSRLTAANQHTLLRTELVGALKDSKLAIMPDCLRWCDLGLLALHACVVNSRQTCAMPNTCINGLTSTAQGTSGYNLFPVHAPMQPTLTTHTSQHPTPLVPVLVISRMTLALQTLAEPVSQSHHMVAQRQRQHHQGKVSRNVSHQLSLPSSSYIKLQPSCINASSLVHHTSMLPSSHPRTSMLQLHSFIQYAPFNLQLSPFPFNCAATSDSRASHTRPAGENLSV